MTSSPDTRADRQRSLPRLLGNMSRNEGPIAREADETL
jgi:hypothetical protein